MPPTIQRCGTGTAPQGGLGPRPWVKTPCIEEPPDPAWALRISRYSRLNPFIPSVYWGIGGTAAGRSRCRGGRRPDGAQSPLAAVQDCAGAVCAGRCRIDRRRVARTDGRLINAQDFAWLPLVDLAGSSAPAMASELEDSIKGDYDAHLGCALGPLPSQPRVVARPSSRQRHAWPKSSVLRVSTSPRALVEPVSSR